jgi:simple sugar transport system ATP-binding protein
MSVSENIAFDQLVGLPPRWVHHTVLRQAAQAVLQRLGIDLDLDAPLNSLPIAERQIVAIARALIGRARMIFMDEPTSSLTRTETDILLSIVRQLSSEGVSVVFVSHRLAEVLDVASRVTVIRDGKLVGVYPTSGMTQSRLTTLMTGQVLNPSLKNRQSRRSQVVMEVQRLSRVNEFDDISFAVHAGEVLGITGLIGSGRTELALVLFGMQKPTAGTMLFAGNPVSFASNREAMAAGIAYVSEDRLSLGLIQPQSIGDNIVLPVLARLSARTGLLSRERIAATVRHWIGELAIKVGSSADAVSTLSGGNQQRVVLSKWLTTEPKLLILDSPTVGVDVGARAGVFDIVRTLADHGLAIVLISDEVSEVYFNADRILHLANGRLADEYDPAQTTIEALESHVYA